MPLEKIVTEPDRAWALWKITETEEELLQQTDFSEVIPDIVTNPVKRLEWLAGRVLTFKLMQRLGEKYQGIVKDDFGKPFLTGCNVQISLTNSYPYVAAIADRNEPVGIDLEQPKEKLLKIASRVLDAAELKNAGTDIVKHCVYWCAKETLIKVYGKKDLVLAENLKITAFERKTEGDIIGKIIVGGKERIVPLSYFVEPTFVLVLSKVGSRHVQ